MMPYLQMYSWANHGYDRNSLDLYLYKKRPKCIEFISEYEWGFDQGYVSECLLEYADKNDVEVKVLLSSQNLWNDQQSRPKVKNLIYEDSPTLIFDYVLLSYNSNVIYNQSHNNDIYNFTPKNDFKYKIVSMINKSLWWRSQMIDHFEEYEVINSNNLIIWRNRLEDPYDFKYFKPRLMADESFVDETGLFDSFHLPKKYSDVWFSAVYESDINVFAITEKLLTPILFLKPFLVLGSRGYHKFLQSLGFQLFEEFIDYSFDDEQDIAERIKKYCQQIAKIDQLSFDDIKKYNRLIENKLIENKKQVYKLYFDQTLKPKIVTHWESIIPTHKEILPTDTVNQIAFYRSMIQRGWYKKFLVPQHL